MRAGLALCGIPLEPVAKAGAFVCVLPINLWQWQLMGNTENRAGIYGCCQNLNHC